jgi:hypothetical protein
LSLLLKFFHQLAKSLFSFPDSLFTGSGVGFGPLEPMAAVEGPPVAMVGIGEVVTPDHSMRVVILSSRDLTLLNPLNAVTAVGSAAVAISMSSRRYNQSVVLSSGGGRTR